MLNSELIKITKKGRRSLKQLISWDCLHYVTEGYYVKLKRVTSIELLWNPFLFY